MHIFITIITLFATWRWADWKHWQRYHSTMLYMTAGGFLYEYFTKDYDLWAFYTNFLPNVECDVLVWGLCTMPFSVLLYLSRFPTGKWTRQIRYIILWVTIYGVAELGLRLTKTITYKHGWNFGYSLLFDAMMFPMLILHHKNPLWAYLLSVPIVVLLLYWFKVPANE